MFNWLRRRRLSADTRKRLLIVAARAEEAIVETHVANLLDLLEVVGDEVDLDRALEIYSEMMSLDEARATTVANRLLARLDGPANRSGKSRPYRNVFREAAGRGK
jgi:hypothetical protein